MTPVAGVPAGRHHFLGDKFTPLIPAYSPPRSQSDFALAKQGAGIQLGPRLRGDERISVSVLLRHDFARAAELFRKILQLGKSVAGRQNRFGIVDVDTGAELQSRQCRSKDVY